jgi:FtsH-binding integral membrane protein
VLTQVELTVHILLWLALIGVSLYSGWFEEHELGSWPRRRPARNWTVFWVFIALVLLSIFLIWLIQDGVWSWIALLIAGLTGRTLSWIDRKRKATPPTSGH